MPAANPDRSGRWTAVMIAFIKGVVEVLREWLARGGHL
jgi:hypothetical protein